MWPPCVGFKFLITSRNEVVAKLMFLPVCVILLTGGCMLGYNHPPRSTHPLGSTTPPPPPGEADFGIRSMGGRYPIRILLGCILVCYVTSIITTSLILPRLLMNKCNIVTIFVRKTGVKHLKILLIILKKPCTAYIIMVLFYVHNVLSKLFL